MSREAPRAGPLSTLEALRRDSVDVLSRQLRAARAELVRCEEVLEAGLAEQLRCERQLALERAAFAASHSVRVLQSVEKRLRACEAEQRLHAERVRRAVLAVTRVRGEADALQKALLTAERDRRAASGVLENQHHQQVRASAQRAEDEADDAFRARR